MYSDYWNLTKPPFDNVPDSSMYVDCHVSMEDVIAETIYAIKEGNECLTVIVGEVGLGKTLSLRVIIDSLEPEKYKVALITNPALSFIQLLREIIGQITGKQCLEKKKVDLLEIFNRLLFETADQGKKIVIVIDEANVLSSSVLDDLRLLTNMQDDDRNLFTLLLVGQMEFAKMLEQPKRANLFQRIGTYGHLEKLPSKEAVKSYIEARLQIAGTQRKIFSDESIPVIWEFSEHGIPRLINKICKLCLKAGETNEFNIISADVTAQIADRFQKLGKTARKAPGRSVAESSEKGIEEPESERLPKRPKSSIPKPEKPEIKSPVRPSPPQMEEAIPVQPKPVMPEQPPVRPTQPQKEEAIPVQPKSVMPEQPPVKSIPPQREEAAPIQLRPAMMDQTYVIKPIPPQPEETPAAIKEIPERLEIERHEVEWEEATPAQPKPVTLEQPTIRPTPPQMEEAIPVQPKPLMPEQPPLIPVPPQREEAIPVQPRAVPLGKPTVAPIPPRAEAIPVQPRNIMPQKTPVSPIPSRREETASVQTIQREMNEQPAQEDKESYEDVLIGQQPIKLTIPAHVIRNAQAADPETKNKLAGYWSAQILKGNPQLAHTSSDPVSLWFDVKNVILKKFNNR